MARIKIDKLLAAYVDIGDYGIPGQGATQITCKIFARRDGRWDCEGRYAVGTNQGYFQLNFERGPWRGRGDTPEDAVAEMIERADDEHQADMRRAGHDALLLSEGETFASLAAFEVRRIESVIRDGESAPCRFARIAGDRYYCDADERMALRRRALKILRRIVRASQAV